MDTMLFHKNHSDKGTDCSIRNETPLTVRFMKHNLVGIVGNFWKFILMLFFREILQIGYLAATALAVEAALLHNFFWHQHWTWSKRAERLTFHRMGIRLFRYHLSVGLMAMIANLGLMRYLVGEWGMHYLSALFLTTAITGTVSFLLAAFWIFLPPPGNKAL